MAEQKRNLRVFVSYPGDVKEERNALRGAIDELNITFGERDNFHLDLLSWETHSYPGLGRPQALITEQIGEYDIFIGIMWKRFGSPTGVAESGTEEEFQNAYQSWKENGRPHVMFYFSQKEFMPVLEELEQIRKVLEFRRELDGVGLVREYKNETTFANTVRPQLFKAVCELLDLESGDGRARLEQRVAFKDFFETFEGWMPIPDYPDGEVVQTAERPHSGKHCLKKEGKGDPSGGYKTLNQTIARGFVFTGWLYHPASRTGGPADRLAIEDETFSGYGFSLTNSCTSLWIEKRREKHGSPVGDKKTVGLNTDTWYRFALHVEKDKTLSLHFYDEMETEVERIEQVVDSEYSQFDRVAVHGGAPFFIDELRIIMR